MRFTYRGRDGVDITLKGIRTGDVIDVPDHLAGRPYSDVRDDDGEILSRDHGTGLLAQPDAWEHDADQDPADLNVDPVPVKIDLDTLTVPQLREVAEEHETDLTGLTRKSDIVAAIQSGLNTTEEA